MKKQVPSWRILPFTMISGVLIGILSLLLVQSVFKSSEPATKISAATLKTSLESANALISTRYHYAKVGQFSNSLELNGWTIPFTQKNFLLSYQGEAALGVNMDQAEVVPDEETQTIDILLPAVEILSNTIEEDSIEVYNEVTNLFNPIKVSDYIQFAKQQKAVAEQELEKQGVFALAEKNAKDAIVSLLDMVPDVKDHYTIDIHFAKCPVKSITGN